MKLVEPFPAPPAPVRAAMRRLREAAAAPKKDDPLEEQRRAAAFAAMPRPWIPTSCDAELRGRLYPWLDDVAGWLNEQYAWQPKTMIPACWPHHAHIVHELAVVAFLRLGAEADSDPKSLEEWHRYNRPLFVERMNVQLAEGCQSGHTRWPGRARLVEYASQEAVESRRAAFRGDTDDDGTLPGVDPRTGEVLDARLIWQQDGS